MAATMKGPVAVEDVNVTFEDQQKINKFARNTSRVTELKNEIEAKKKSLQNLQDASDDLMMLDDDALLIPYQIGNVFVSHSQEETQEMLEAAKEALEQELSGPAPTLGSEPPICPRASGVGILVSPRNSVMFFLLLA
uniref:Prefoldin subunit 4 n=1 Tax=Sparus aurata TaxID=8175 RepID=A0A671TYM0_SPAAU